jgi:acetyl-CoA carboxylase biotin carboxylase subunit
MRLLGDKVAARRAMKEAGVPVVPGSDGPLEFSRETVRFCAEIGYPVLVKAAAGGGGKGMRVIKKEADLETGIQMCMAEAKRSFDDPRVYVEKYVTSSRHIEIQVMGDRSGSIVHLGERDCSCQRRHQKLLEESPAPGFDRSLREQLGAWAVAAARAAGYVGAGTVEFICDEKGGCYFMEMNARLQVEHPVTEMVTGTDIVREQVLIAAGENLSLHDLASPRGHAIECRIYAEDPDSDFAPCPGFVSDARLPSGPGIRVDSALVPRTEIPPFYDPLVAKVIAWAPDRESCVARMERALAETRIEGVKTTVGFHRRLLRNPRFQKGKVTTSMLDEA